MCHAKDEAGLLTGIIVWCIYLSCLAQ